MSNERCAYSENGGPHEHENRFKKSSIAYFIKLGITWNVLEKEVDLEAEEPFRARLR